MQGLTWFGFEIDARNLVYNLPSTKESKIILQALTLSAVSFTTAGTIASLIEKIVSSELALELAVKLQTKTLCTVVAYWNSCDIPITMTGEAGRELLLWHSNTRSLNSQPIFDQLVSQFSLYTDARASVGGGFILNFNDTAYFAWDESQVKSTGTDRERLALKYSLLSLVQCFEGKVVAWYCDNQNACRIAIYGSMHCVRNKRYSIDA